MTPTSSSSAVARTRPAVNYQHALVDEGLGHLDPGDQVGDQELVVLEAADRLSERLALAHVVDRLGQDGGCVRHVAHRGLQPFLGRPLHHVHEAAVHGHPHMAPQ